MWALPLAAAPVIIHLFHRHRQEVIQWGAMQFLMEGATRRTRMWRIDDLLLLILRTMAVLLIVLALAQPMINAGWITGSNSRNLVLVIDQSMSTARTDDSGTVSDRIIERATSIVDELGVNDTLQVLLAGGADQWLVPQPLERSDLASESVRERILALRPSLATADFLVSAQLAVEADLPESAVARDVVIVTDGRAHGWRSRSAQAWADVKRSIEKASVTTNFHVVDVSKDREEGIANLSVESINAARTRVAVESPLIVTAQLKNTGDSPTEPTTVDWTVNGQPAGSSSVVGLDPDQTAHVSLTYMFEKPGAFAIRCNADYPDQLPLDNDGTIVVEAVESVPILVVDEQANGSVNELGFLMAAFGGESQDATGWTSVFQPTVADFEELEELRLSEFQCILLIDPPELSETMLGTLEGYVETGGGLWITLGQQAEIEPFNERFYNQGNGLIPLPVEEAAGHPNGPEEFLSIHPPSTEHPATALLGDTQRLDLDNAKVFRHFRFAAPQNEGTVSVLLETGGGEPLAVEKYLGAGRVIVLGVPLDASWSNLPLCQAYVPLIHEWLWYLTAPTATSWNLSAGEPILLKLPQDQRDLVKLQTPSGDDVVLMPTSDEDRLLYRFAETGLPGSYHIQIDTDDETLGYPFYVGRDAEESNLQPLDDSQQQALSETGPVRFAGELLALPRVSGGKQKREPLWNLLLAALLLLMVTELLLARWSAKQRVGPEPASAPGLSIK